MDDINNTSRNDTPIKKKFDWESFKKRLENNWKIPEFEGNPDLEKEFQNALEKLKTLPENPENLVRIKKVNEYVLDVDKKCLELDTDKMIDFLRKELDNLTSQRPKWVYDDVLEDKITLISMRYYKIVGTRPR